jgi:protein-tyrosine phosphatase
MAEFIFKKMVEEKGMVNKLYIASCATSREEIGNSVYAPARKKLITINCLKLSSENFISPLEQICM